jgi:hypothetical protein
MVRRRSTSTKREEIGLRTMTFVAALLACVALAACGDDNGGSESGGSDEDEIRQVIALGNSLDPEICDKVTDRWLENVTGGSQSDCEDQLKNSKEDAIEFEQVSVEGDKATVTATIQGDSGRLLLVKEDDEWKLDDIQQGE